MVTVMFLGSGDAFGSGGRFQTCILVESSSSNILIDCGATSLVAMKQHGITPASVGIILISHLHGDHFGGLPFFILDAQFSKREAPLVIAGPRGTEARIREAMEVLFPKSSETTHRFSLEFLELAAGRRAELGSLRVMPVEVVHFSGAPAYALRVEIEGRSIVYSGDTEWTDALISASQGADLFICEAYFFEKKIPFHLDYRTLEGKRPALTCKRVVLTHMSADMLARLGSLQVECAYDGKTLHL